MTIKKISLKRFLFSTLGVLFIGVGCGLVIEMALGNGTCDCLYRSVYYLIGEKIAPVSYGIVNLLMNLIFFVAMIFIRPDLIGYGTVFNMVSIGYIIDFVQWIFKSLDVSGVELHVALRVIIILAAIPVIAFGDALYFDADLGVSPYDGISFMLEKLLRYRLSFRVVRTIGDSTFLILGFVIGMVTNRQWELANIGTLLMALLTGYLIDFFRKRVTGKLFAVKQ